jgi:hypothetical protein
VIPIIEEPVLIESGAPAGNDVAVANAFSRAGFEVDVEAAIERRGLGDFPWLVRVAVEGSLAGFFGAFGVDGYAAVKRWIRDVWNAREGAGNGRGSIEVVDSGSSHLILSNTLPDEALNALMDIDWSELSGGYIVWNAERGEWVDHLARN